MGTGADLVDRCKFPDNPKERDLDWLREYSACAAYVEGVFEANQEAGDLGVCFPEKMNGLAFPGDVMKYRRQHPDRLGWSAAKFALEAIREAYPCPRRPN